MYRCASAWLNSLAMCRSCLNFREEVIVSEVKNPGSKTTNLFDFKEQEINYSISYDNELPNTCSYKEINNEKDLEKNIASYDSLNISQNNLIKDNEIVELPNISSYPIEVKVIICSNVDSEHNQASSLSCVDAHKTTSSNNVVIESMVLELDSSDIKNKVSQQEDIDVISHNTVNECALNKLAYAQSSSACSANQLSIMNEELELEFNHSALKSKYASVDELENLLLYDHILDNNDINSKALFFNAKIVQLLSLRYSDCNRRELIESVFNKLLNSGNKKQCFKLALYFFKAAKDTFYNNVYVKIYNSSLLDEYNEYLEKMKVNFKSKNNQDSLDVIEEIMKYNKIAQLKLQQIDRKFFRKK